MVYTNVFISICAVALASYCYLLLFNELPSSNVLGFLFFSTLFAYNFHRKVGSSSKERPIGSLSDKEIWLKRHQSLIYLLILGSFGIAAYYCYSFPKAVLTLLFPLSFLSIFYVLEVNKIPSLRSLPFLKIFIIAFVWGGATVLLPLLKTGSLSSIFQWESQLFVIVIALFVLAETLPFDIRDIEDDQKEGIRTLPQQIGIRNSKLLSIAIYVISYLLFWILIKEHPQKLMFLISYGLSLLYSSIWILGVHSKRQELFYSLGVESTLCMPLVFYYTIAAFLK